ncbi:ABC-type enterochelin transport system, permease component [Snodgrassella alvi SCGC AB-598-O02]|nr:ABC-type enterochelin transport system, permease component [Snodgrassella alvi SCGC AB-598-O02]
MIFRYMNCAFIVLCILSLYVGTDPISWQGLFAGSEADWLTLKASRIPRLIAIVLTGMGLSIGGVILQHIVRNKFVEPETAGGLDAAKLGIMISLVVLPSAGVFSKMLAALALCFVAGVIYIMIVARIRYQQVVLIPVIGLMFGSVLSAGAEFYAYKNNLLQDVQGWLLGDFSRVVQGHYEILYVIVPVIVLTYVFAKRFTVIGMGQEMATSLGVSYKSTVALGLMLVSITVAATVISVGAIPFIGLVIPNLVALKYGEHLAKTLPLVAIGGACLLLICDLAGRLLIYPFEVPIGLTAGAVGGIVFLLLILRGLR